MRVFTRTLVYDVGQLCSEAQNESGRQGLEGGWTAWDTGTTLDARYKQRGMGFVVQGKSAYTTNLHVVLYVLPANLKARGEAPLYTY